MPTARELLDQADALMRRNRKRGKGRLGDVPTLTDALGSSIAPTVVLPAAEGEADPIVLDAESATAKVGEEADAMSLDTLGDLPVLTDVVLGWPGDDVANDELDAALTLQEPAAPGVDGIAEPAPETTIGAGDAFPASAAEAEAAAAELLPPAVLESEAAFEADSAQEASERPVQPTPPASGARVPFLDDDFILEIPPPDENAPPPAAAAVPAPGAAPESLVSGTREWDALAEEIRMQVLQRLDLFTDTGLREQLGARLAPIVERASAQLIETINRELGELVRGYVAEAIEREIDSWRNQQPKP
jgi:hypothetical protein